MRERSGGPRQSYNQGGAQSGAGGYNRQQQTYQDPFGFGFGFDPFGFGGFETRSNTGRESPEMQAANNYIRNGYYTEALNVLNSIPPNQRTARWHYYAALACSGLGQNVRAHCRSPRRRGYGAQQLRIPALAGPAAKPKPELYFLSTEL